MIPIHSQKSLEHIEDNTLKSGLEKEFQRLPSDYVYPTYGYFIVIESLNELHKPIALSYGALTHTPEPLSDYVEMVEEFEGYSQVVCILDADFGVSLFISEEIATQAQLEALFEM